MTTRTDLDLNEFRARLIKERQEMLNSISLNHRENLEESADATENELSSVVSPAADENADTAAVWTDIERYEALDENSHDLLRQIDHALDRIEEGSYGICEITGKPIPVERLRALPWVTTTVEAAENGPL